MPVDIPPFASKDTMDEPLNLHKEASTVGDLISFGELPNKRRLSDQRRHSISDSNIPFEFGRRRSLHRSDSEKTLVGKSSRRSPSTTPTRSGAQTDRTDYRYQNRDDFSEGYKNGNKRRMSRRDSMMNVLREDLEKIPCLAAIGKRHSSKRVLSDEDNEDIFAIDSDTDDEQPVFQNGRRSRRLSSISFSKKSGSTSSFGSGQYILTDAEIRKLKFLETLNKMKGEQPTRSRHDSLASQTDEVAVLEASFAKGKKRGSIATHVLMAARKRRVPLSERDRTKASVPIRKTKSPVLTDTEDMSEEQRERSKKIFQLLKKQEKPKLPSIIGKDKESVTKEDVAKESIMGFRRRLRRKKMSPVQVWRKRANFLVLLLRAWKIHSNAINESLVANNDSLEMMTRGNQADLMFDVTQYKAVKEAKVSQEAKRILMKKPNLRTEEEKHYLQIFLRNYKSIAEYPVKMQKMIAQRSWVESYEAKRVIVREGHVPMCFYFILSGAGVVSTMEKGVQKTVMFLNRGDSFGDVAILNKTRRQTTVISRETVELLCMTDEDFEDIFMSGGLQDPDDPFLKSINFLDGWPREKLIDNPKKCIFSYFKRGTVLVSDSNNSDWIFVVKSGSCSILKMLQTVDISKKPRRKKKLDFREEVLQVMQNERYLSHEEQLQLMFEEEKHSLEDQSLHVRFYALPEINVRTNDGYNELKQMKDEYMNANTVNRALIALEKLADDGADVKSEAGNSDVTSKVGESVKKMASHRRKSINFLKGPFMHKTGGLGREHSFASASSRRGSILSRNSRKGSSKSNNGSEKTVKFATTLVTTSGVEDIDHIKKVDDWQDMSLPSIAASPINDLTIRQEVKPLFVEVQSLTKGQIFGMTDLLFENQPQFSLVSNGSECVMVEKKFFLENASQSLMVRLRENTYPYPSNEALQENLESQIRWDHHKNEELAILLREVKLKKTDKNDARGYLQVASVKS